MSNLTPIARLLRVQRQRSRRNHQAPRRSEVASRGMRKGSANFQVMLWDEDGWHDDVAPDEYDGNTSDGRWVIDYPRYP